MGVPIVIAGFPPSNRVPGAYGEVLFGVGGQSAASLPLALLCVGLKTSGSIVPDTQVVKILSTADADTCAGAGSELACMLYDALALGGNAGVPVFACSPTPANGATAATLPIRFSGTATAVGAVMVRINGKVISQGIQIGDTASVIATNLAAAISGNSSGRLPLSASAATSYCTVTCRTSGQRGMQHVLFLDTTQLPAGVTAQLWSTWASGATYAIGDVVQPKASPNGFYFKATAITTGTSGVSEPTWPTTIGQTVVDSGVTWTCWGSTATGNAPTQALFLGNGTGLETYTALLTTISSQSYDRIALAANDSVSLAAWKTQVDQYAAAPTNFMQAIEVGLNGTLTAATSVTQTTLNDPAFQFLWCLNSETHPSRIAAAMGATRALAEQANPNAAYDSYVLTTVAPQSQQVDWPTLPTLISAINAGVTPVDSHLGDNLARITRSITTKCLTGGSPDYSTIDTGQWSTPVFVLRDAKLYWSSILQPNNPVCQDDPPTGQRQPPSGVLTPSRVVAALFGRLVDFSLGILSGRSATVPPIVQAPQAGDVTATFDATPGVNRIMAAENVRVMPINHQLGVSVRQAA